MVFASPIFLFLFLPLVLAAYFSFPGRWRNGVLLVASLAFYAWGEARDLPLVLGSVASNWLLGRAIGGSTDLRIRQRWLAVAIAPVLALPPLAVTAIPWPLGISFFTSQAISYVVDVHKRNAAAEHSMPRFALYILLFPQLTPIRK